MGTDQGTTKKPETYREAYARLPASDDTQGHVAYHHPEITLERVHEKAEWLMGLDSESRAVMVAKHFGEMYYATMNGGIRMGDHERYTLHYAIQRIGWQ